MDLARRLSRLREAAAVEPSPPADPRVAELRTKLDALVARQKASEIRHRDRRTPIPLPGVEEETPHGRLHLVLQHLEPAHRHGRVAVEPARRVSGELVAKLALDRELARLDFSRALYVDTETTGLMGGTGTLPFLIGLAWFEDAAFAIAQLLLRTPGEEVPMLVRLSEHLERASCLVTYNGKSFDWPLLKARYVMNRLPIPRVPPHLDLLHAARRIWKRRLGRVRLVNLESGVLGHHREDDVDGSEIPARYWAFVRGADGSVLAPVIEHNAQDLVALAAVLAELVERFDGLDPRHEPADQLGLGLVALRAKDSARAARFLDAAAEGGEPEVAALARKEAAVMALAVGEVDAAEAHLLAGLEVAPEALRPALHLALAKLYEHKKPNLRAALRHAREAAAAESLAANERRLARLERKLGVP